MSNKTEFEHPESVVDFEKPELATVSSSGEKVEAGDEEHQGTKRRLEARHIQMIALGGTIGTGIFLNSGYSIVLGGPAGALIAYCVIGFLVYCIMTCVGEMSTYIPISGGVYRYATRFMDRSLGFSLGINTWWGNVSIAVELTAAATVLRFWNPVMPDAAWASIFWVAIVAVNLFSVRLYGEIEYWLALLKVLVIVVFIIVAILVTSGAVGGQTIGFTYWNNPGAFKDGGLGFFNVLLGAGFSFLGTDDVALAAGETKNPTKAIPRAIRNVFWRILIFYIATMLLLGMCLPYDDPALDLSGGDSSTASFTLVFQKAGIGAGAHIINACVFISIISAANEYVYGCSRIMLGMARDGNLPKIFTRVNRFGSPYFAVFGSTTVAFVCIFISIYSAETVLVWCLNLTSVSGFIYWSNVGFIHYRFRRGYVHQGRDLKDLPFKTRLYPFGSLFAAILPIIIVLGQGYGSFYPQWDAKTFVSSYIGVVPFFLAFFLHKIFTKSKVIPLDKLDYDTGAVSRADIIFDEENDTRWNKWTSYFG